MFGPVVTSEAHVALAGASQHTTTLQSSQVLLNRSFLQFVRARSAWLAGVRFP